MEAGRKFYTPNNAARALDVSRSTRYALLESGAIKYVTIGADRRIPAEEIARIATEGTAVSGAK